MPKSSRTIWTPRALRIVQNGRFRDLNLKALSRQTDSAQCSNDIEGKRPCLELVRGEVDRYSHLVRPFSDVCTGLLQNPSSDLRNETHLLGNGNELGG